MSDLHYWLALNSLPDIGPVTARKLLSAFGSPENLFNAPERDILNVEGIGRNRIKNIIRFNGWENIKQQIEKAEQKNIDLITLSDKRYPEGLRHITDAPLVLHVKGTLEYADKYAVAIVGSRNATSYGALVAEKIGYELASSGLTVISGMARGIDAISHRAALRAGGRTVAVLGSGIDVPYPVSNRQLMDSVASSGAVISEFPMGTVPNRENFPRRNRIISALSFGVVVIEAALDSGSLITVGYALEQGKEIFAVPGNINSENSRGTNALIKKGAKLVESADDILSELSLQLKNALKEKSPEKKTALPEMNEEERLLYCQLGTEPKHIDTIVRSTALPVNRALSILLGLELKGFARQTEGKNFSVC